MVDLGSLILLMSIFGAKVAVIYVLAGLVIAVIGGSIIEKMHMEKYLVNFIYDTEAEILTKSTNLNRKECLQYAKEQMVDTLRKVLPYILIGVAIGAFIHNWIPQNSVENLLGNKNLFGVILAVIAGTPMYADIFGTIPVAEALLDKGALLGTILAFMMAVTTLSLPSIIMLRKVVTPRLLILFILICIIGITLVGYLFNIFHQFFI